MKNIEPNPTPGCQLEPVPPVDGSALLTEIKQIITQYVVLPPGAADALALWVLHTHAFEHRDLCAYLGIESPERRCGKSTPLHKKRNMLRFCCASKCKNHQ